MDVFEYLEKTGLEYGAIDIERFPRFWSNHKDHFVHPRVIQIVGTNGKGSTGRFLSVMLKNLGYNVGHFTSPHIMRFNERIWINGEDISDETLNLFHDELIEKIPEAKNLSYFEYATLLAYRAFAHLDFAIMEAGLGGEYDATSAFERELTLFTPIDIDHIEYLGDSVESIALTKLKCAPKNSLIGLQPHQNIIDQVIKQLADENPKKQFYRYDAFLTEQEQEIIEKFVQDSQMPPFQSQNLSLSIAALKYLGFEFSSSLLAGGSIFGRSQRLAPNIVVDVGHNLLAAKALVNSLKEKEFSHDAILVYNTMRDKAYREILKELRGEFTKIYLLPLENPRAANMDELKSSARELGYTLVESFDIEKDELVVFGSFFTLNAFLKSRARRGQLSEG